MTKLLFIMSVFDKREDKRYEILKTLVALHHNATFLDNGATPIELLNHGASSKGLRYVVKEGYATMEIKEINDMDIDFYRANNKGKTLLNNILDSIDSD